MRLRSFEHGYQLVLDEPIVGSFAISTAPEDYDLIVKFEGLGAFQVSAQGAPLKGSLNIRAVDQENNRHQLLLKSELNLF